VFNRYKGIIFRLGERLAELEDKVSPLSGPQNIHLFVYEVSYCRQDELCDSTRSGIQPYLVIQLVADPSTFRSQEPSFNESFVEPYNPRAWIDTQRGLLGGP
jgi:hypothetical protein